MIDSYEVTSNYLIWVGSAIDQRGRPAVDFSLSSLGADRLGQLTTKIQPDNETGFSRHLGIVFDDELISATALRSVITNKGQVSGKFSIDEVDSIITILNAGSLPFRIRQVSGKSVAE